MKINSGCVLCLGFLVTLQTTLAKGTLALADEPCVIGGFSLDIDGECNLDEILAAYKELLDDLDITCTDTPIQDLRLQLGLAKNANDELTEEKIKDVCKTAYDSALKIPFKYAHRQSDKNGDFTQLYYNGGTYWNEEVETKLETGEKTHILEDDAQTVEDFYDTVASDTHVAWPGDLPNFDLATCEIGAAMCCWPQDRQANDNNGNCAKQYDEKCVDKDPADNTDLCYVDMSRAPFFNKGTAGFMTFPGDNNGGEGAIHCHGFAWADDDADPSSRYKANNLFYVSMYDHMLQRGYVRNIPGAPMCGCIEQMPTATRSDCTQIDVAETYRITKDGSGLMTAKIKSIDIDYNACQGVNNRNNDLSAYFHQLHEDGKVSNDKRAALGKYLVEKENCPAATAHFMSTKGYVEGYNYDEKVWNRFAEKGTESEITMGSTMFNIMLEDSPNMIVTRMCPECADSHKQIFYRREKPVGTTNILDKLLNKWDNGPGNRFKQDYNLYSTYDDAKSKTNAWEYCNAGSSRGFPYECGPTGRVQGQSSKFNNNSGQSNVVFFMEKGSSTVFGPVTGDLSSGDIGSVTMSGTASTLSNDRYYITGTGDIWNRNDKFTFVRQEADGDLTLQVLVNSLTYTDKWAKAGIMIRQDVSQDSINFACVAPARKRPFATFRTSKGSNTYSTGNPPSTNNFTPVYLKITKQGRTFKCLESSNGQNWSTLGTKTMQVFNSNEYFVGMAVSSHEDDEMTDAVFQDYSMVAASGDETGNDQGNNQGNNQAPGGLNNYEFTAYKDSSGNDIMRRSGGVEDYAEWCNSEDSCKGFNSNGWMKSAIKSRRRWSRWTNDSSKGLYVKA